MKRIVIILAMVMLIGMLATPVFAGGPVRIGEQLRVQPVVIDFPANQPFHIAHGWLSGTPGVEKCVPDPSTTPNPIGLAEFRLEVDGVYVDESFVDREAQPCGGPAIHSWAWVFNFPEGMSGTHTFTGHWIVACREAIENGYEGVCETPNAMVELITRTLTVNFTQP